MNDIESTLYKLYKQNPIFLFKEDFFTRLELCPRAQEILLTWIRQNYLI